ncbi:MAG: PQQ-binding-like beta-propeller repeat protein [Myxococcota bacterium]
MVPWVILFSVAMGGDPLTERASSEAVSTTGDAAEIVTKSTILYNDVRRYQAAPKAFRPGHVSPRSVDSLAVTRTSGRFEVRFPSGAPIVTPALHAGLVFVSGGFSSHEVFAVHQRTGKPAWGATLDDDGPSNAACEGGLCVFNTESCTVFAVDAKTGAHRWSHWLGDPLTSAPTIGHGLVFVAWPSQVQGQPPGHSHALGAFDLKTGELKWRRWIDGDVLSAPVVAGVEVLVTTFSGTIYRFGAKDGDVVQARQAKATSAPVVRGDDLYYSQRIESAGGAAAEGVIRESRTDQKKVWMAARKRARYIDEQTQASTGLHQQGTSLDAGNGFVGGAPSTAKSNEAMKVVGAGTVATMQSFQGSRVLALAGRNIATMGNEVVSTDAKTGKRQWSTPLPGDLSAGGSLGTAPIAAGGSIFVATLQGEVLELSPKDGTVKRKLSLGAAIRAQPVIDGGWLYAGTTDGRLIGLDLGHARYVGWTTWGRDAARTGAVP